MKIRSFSLLTLSHTLNLFFHNPLEEQEKTKDSKTLEDLKPPTRLFVDPDDLLEASKSRKNGFSDHCRLFVPDYSNIPDMISRPFATKSTRLHIPPKSKPPYSKKGRKQSSRYGRSRR